MLVLTKPEDLQQARPNPRGRQTSWPQQTWALHDSATEEQNRLCALQPSFPYRMRKEGAQPCLSGASCQTHHVGKGA